MALAETSSPPSGPDAATIDRLCDAIRASARGRARVVVGIAGPPASGKSTLAEAVTAALVAAGEAAILLPMDGFHLDNSELEPRGLLPVKGAPETFDAEGFVALVQAASAAGAALSYPTFDRSRDCTVPGGGHIDADSRIIVAEGNYLLLDRPPWNRLAGIFALSVLLRESEETLTARLIDRWTGHGFDRAGALAKAEGNDLPNARTVLRHSAGADLVIEGAGA